jgi:NTE family protein
MLLPGEKVVLVLQGGGALGAYQAGAYEALSEAGIEPDWVTGISIGAVNGAIIAGNRPENRLARLREFWETISDGVASAPFGNNEFRIALNEFNAARVATFGVPGFFTPRIPPAFLLPPGSEGATSLYTTAPLRETLEGLIDFDRLNDGKIRYSIGAVEIVSGNFQYFDTAEREINVHHVMASGALPPGFPAVEIEGRYYWDGGVVSNTPMQYMLDMTGQRVDSCIFQIDLFSARGLAPKGIPDVVQREKEIRYSSRTRLNTKVFTELQSLRRAVCNVVEKLPPDMQNDPDVELLREHSCNAAITIVHLIHRRAAYERFSMDYEFSRLSMLEHWQAGLDDVRHTLAHPAWRNRKRPERGVAVLDLTREDEDRLKTVAQERR